MPKFEIFYGTWQAHSDGIYEYSSREEAEQDAYMKAIEDYQSYEGHHGILSYEECKEDAINSWGCEDWTEEDFDQFYQETVDNTISWYVEEVFDDER